MDNLDMRCPADSVAPMDDKQVELCHKLSMRWRLQDQLIAKKRWGADESKRSVASIASRLGMGRVKVENRIEWMRDCVIEECVKNVNIYA